MADVGLVIAIIGTGITLVGSMLAIFLWVRSEANSDRREFFAALQGLQKEFNMEMKDYHGRLCKIEEDRNNILLSRK